MKALLILLANFTQTRGPERNFPQYLMAASSLFPSLVEGVYIGLCPIPGTTPMLTKWTLPISEKKDI